MQFCVGEKKFFTFSIFHFPFYSILLKQTIFMALFLPLFYAMKTNILNGLMCDDKRKFEIYFKYFKFVSNISNLEIFFPDEMLKFR